ncbi:MAG: hemin uptake protein HemP [Pseudomonadota bacterium]
MQIPVAEHFSSTESQPDVPRLSRTLNSSDLLAGRREIIIDHDGELYRLRHTKNGKLILNK